MRPDTDVKALAHHRSGNAYRADAAGRQVAAGRSARRFILVEHRETPSLGLRRIDGDCVNLIGISRGTHLPGEVL